MKADYVHKDTLTATDYVELNKNNELLMSYNQALLKENKQLKEQLEYLRSGEYYNQLRFENEMLQKVVDTNGVPIEVYDYIDCTHRNTELLKENQELKKQLTTYQILHRDCNVDNLKNISKIEEMENQQKEFIDYLEDLIKQNETVVEVSKYGLPKNCSKLLIDFYKEILQKYKEIIGESDDKVD